jgi:hypothetical protein
MTGQSREPLFVEVRSSDRNVVAELTAAIALRFESATAEFGKVGGLYRVAFAEAAEPAT